MQGSIHFILAFAPATKGFPECCALRLGRRIDRLNFNGFQRHWFIHFRGFSTEKFANPNMALGTLQLRTSTSSTQSADNMLRTPTALVLLYNPVACFIVWRLWRGHGALDVSTRDYWENVRNAAAASVRWRTDDATKNADSEAKKTHHIYLAIALDVQRYFLVTLFEGAMPCSEP